MGETHHYSKIHVHKWRSGNIYEHFKASYSSSILATKIKQFYPKIKTKIKIPHFWFRISYLLISKFSSHYYETSNRP